MNFENPTGEAETLALIQRLARPRPEGGHVIERSALLASGSGFTAATRWIEAHGGVAEARAPGGSRKGIHGQRIGLAESTAPPVPVRFLLPAGAFD
jgi:hypothetical protein